jgi:DNA modification methylase
MERILAGPADDVADLAQWRSFMNVLDQEITDSYALYHGDCVDVLRGMPDSSIHYTIFSPPFASLYTYSASPRDMGNCADSDEFFKHFEFLIPELFRVTKPGRLLSFHCMLLPTSKSRDGFIGLNDFRGDLIRRFKDCGWIHHSEVVIWKDPVIAMQRTKALGLLHKQLKKDSCMSRQGIPDYLVTMRKPGDNPEPVRHDNESFPVGVWQKYASPIWTDIDPGDTLQYRSAREHEDERHVCPLQLEVIRRAMRLWTNPGDTVCSPFAGIGSEGFVAVEMGRRFVGAELKGSYFEQGKRNLSMASPESDPQASLFSMEEIEEARVGVESSPLIA